MPSVVNYTDCPSCGHRHHFCLLSGEVVARQAYDFRCPETGKMATVVPKRSGEPIRYVPQGAVELSPQIMYRMAA